MIKVIAFDYAGVVSPKGPIVQWMKKHLPENHESKRLFKENAHKWDKGETGMDKVYETASIITGVSADLIWETFYEDTFLHSEVVELIKKLKKTYRIFLFSNYCGELLWKLLEKHQIRDLFDEIIISSEYKMKKPEQNFFELLVKMSNVDKSEIVFIDDQEDNFEASKAFGINTVLFKNDEQLVNDLINFGVKI
jgi:HAD superfamily hydrolase (TIGR01549 family)